MAFTLDSSGSLLSFGNGRSHWYNLPQLRVNRFLHGDDAKSFRCTASASRMDNLDELLWSCNGDGALITNAEWHRIHDHVLAKLTTFLGSPAILNDTPSVDAGFSTSFTTADSRNCLKHRLRGTFAVGFPGREYACVQGFVYAYKNDTRVTLPSGENHIYIRYARIDADDNDWPMANCTGESDWRSYGWSIDQYGEFEGFERWPGA